MKKGKQKKEPANANAKEESKQEEGPIVSKNGQIWMTLSVKPGAKFDGITGFEPEGVGLAVMEQPRQGEAN